MKLTPQELVLFADLWSALHLRARQAATLMQRGIIRRARKPKRGKHRRKVGKLSTVRRAQ